MYLKQVNASELASAYSHVKKAFTLCDITLKGNALACVAHSCPLQILKNEVPLRADVDRQIEMFHEC